MRLIRFAAVVTALIGMVSVERPALAQEKPVSFHIVGQGNFPLSDSRNNFKDGWGIGAGLTFHLNEGFGLRLDYSYNRQGLKGEVFQVTRLDGSHSLQNIDLNAVFYTAGSDDSSLYLLGGGGAYRRQVEITRFEGYAGGVVCNPWWYFCYPGSVPVESVLGSRSVWDLGVDAGLGYQFAMGGEAKFFIETRYHYVFGSKVEGPTAETVQSGNEKATGQYVYLTAGFRF